MDTLKKLYRIGNGPSSSHTMGPKNAATIFLNKNKNADLFVVELYGSLGATGKGHLTDKIIVDTFSPVCTKVIFKPEVVYDYHSNGMHFYAYSNDVLIDDWLCFSIGGGAIRNLNESNEDHGKVIYKEKTMAEIIDYCIRKNIDLCEYVFENEPDIVEYLESVIDVMLSSVDKGLKEEGYLPGELKVKRRAKEVYKKYLETGNEDALLFSSSLAVAEENASGAIVVTAPTCGSAGVIPGVVYTYYKLGKFHKDKLVKSLAVAGIIGNIVKANASISGAEVGCQGEVGTACAMASAMIAYLNDASINQIEYAAEIALEHHLGMTCDPVMGYVQIPCIERNAISSKRAVDSAMYAMLTDGHHFISLDEVIESMNETGRDLNQKYKETSRGGLAVKGIKK